MSKLKDLLEKAKHAQAAELPFVIYRKPDSKIISCLIQKDKKLQFVKNYKESGFVIAPFLHNDKAVLFSDKNTVFYSGDCDLESLDSIDFRGDKINDGFEDDGKKKHLKLVAEGIKAIHQSGIRKVVLSRQEVLNLDAIDIAVIFKKLLLKYPAAFVYIWYHPEVGLWAGASPETLIEAREGDFRTMALAGTTPFLGNKEIAWGEKEIDEQQLVTDHIANELQEMQISIGAPYNKKAGNLVHICTDIHGKMTENQDLNTLIRTLHPTAAVCGLPKKSAKNFILEHEGYNRGFYTGFLGELNLSKMIQSGTANKNKLPETILFVNLRCMQLISEPENSAILYVGGGITSASIPELEWEETIAKSKVMKSVIFDSFK